MKSSIEHSMQSADCQRLIRSLSALAANGLLPMYDSENRLFCFRRKRTATGLIREGVSPRYTVIALMGLHRLEQTGVTSPIEIKPALEVLLADTRWVNNLGDLKQLVGRAQHTLSLLQISDNDLKLSRESRKLSAE